MKKCIFLLLLVLLAVTMVWAGGVQEQETGSVKSSEQSTKTGEQETVQLTFWNWWGGAREPLMNTVLERFMEEYPWIEVENVIQPWTNREEVLYTAMVSNDPPSLIMASNTEVASFADKGLIQPIDKFVEKRKLNLDMFYDAEISTMYWKGDLYSLPMPTTGSDLFMFINRKMLVEAGYDVDTVPETWSDVREISEKITRKDNRGFLDQIGVGFTGILGLIYTNGGKLVSEDGQTALFDTPQVLEALEFALDYTNDVLGGYQAYNDFLTSPGIEEGQNPFMQGKMGILIHQVPAFFLIEQLAPDLEYNVCLYPYNEKRPEGKNKLPGSFAGWGYVIPETLAEEKVEAAYLLLEWITAEKDGAGYFLFEQGRPSPVKAFNEDPAYNDINAHWNVVIEALENRVPTRITPVTPQIENILNDLYERVMYKEMTPKEGVKWAQEKAQNALDEYFK
jgi:ABC-type glycerol-3-phosphate transport system substrate-binding protein